MILRRFYSNSEKKKEDDDKVADKILGIGALGTGAAALGLGGRAIYQLNEASPNSFWGTVKNLYGFKNRERRKKMLERGEKLIEKAGGYEKLEKKLEKLPEGKVSLLGIKSLKNARASKILGGTALGLGTIYGIKKLADKD